MNRIKQLRENKNMLQDELAKVLNVTQKTISNYENGTRDIPTEYLIKLAEFFNVSTDYLLGTSDVKNNTETFDKDKLYFALSKEDEDYISDELKDKILEFAKFAIEQEKKKKEK